MIARLSWQVWLGAPHEDEEVKLCFCVAPSFQSTAAPRLCCSHYYRTNQQHQQHQGPAPEHVGSGPSSCLSSAPLSHLYSSLSLKGVHSSLFCVCSSQPPCQCILGFLNCQTDLPHATFLTKPCRYLVLQTLSMLTCSRQLSTNLAASTHHTLQLS